MKTRNSGKQSMKRTAMLSAAFVLMLLMFCPLCYGAEGYDQVASSSDQASSKEVVKYGMIPIRAVDVNEGTYEIEAVSSSSFFRIEKAVLKVRDGKMTVDATLSSASYKFVYPGTAEEAAAAPADRYIKLKERDGQGSFQLRVSGLNEGIPCAAFSKKKKLWYDRTILFDAASLPPEALKITLPDYDRIEDALAAENSGKDGNSGTQDAEKASEHQLASYEPVPIEMDDGEYSIQVNMTGGSGRASVSSPTWLIVKDGKAYARLMWSSTYYDYMIVGGKKILNETTDGGNSTFTVPIAVMDEPMPVIADTTAMGDPVEIEYELTFYRDSIGSKSQIPQEAAINVLIVALIMIGAGGLLNLFLKRRKKQ